MAQLGNDVAFRCCRISYPHCLLVVIKRGSEFSLSDVVVSRVLEGNGLLPPQLKFLGRPDRRPQEFRGSARQAHCSVVVSPHKTEPEQSSGIRMLLQLSLKFFEHCVDFSKSTHLYQYHRQILAVGSRFMC